MGEVVVWVRVVVAWMAITTVKGDNGATAFKNDHVDDDGNYGCGNGNDSDNADDTPELTSFLDPSRRQLLIGYLTGC